MKEFKGTKGEWKCVHYQRTATSPSTHEIQYGEDGECVAEYVEDEYDAQLIASAPELLEALLYFRDCYESWSDAHNDVKEKVEETINKALGKETI